MLVVYIAPTRRKSQIIKEYLLDNGILSELRPVQKDILSGMTEILVADEDVMEAHDIIAEFLRQKGVDDCGQAHSISNKRW